MKSSQFIHVLSTNTRLLERWQWYYTVLALFMHSLCIQMNDWRWLCWVCPGVRGQVRGCWPRSPSAGPGVTGNMWLLVSTWWSGSASTRYLCSLIEQSGTTGLTQTVTRSGHCIPKDQRESCQTLVLLYYCAIIFLKHYHSNRLQASIWNPFFFLRKIHFRHSSASVNAEVCFYWWRSDPAFTPTHLGETSVPVTALKRGKSSTK